MTKKSMVLIVDDDEIYLMLLMKLFKNAGITASCATSGAEALKELAAHSFNCMITDLNMPRMNGIDLAKKAKQLAPWMLIVLCTGNDRSDVSWDAFGSGIEAVFTKPVNYADLLAWVIEKNRMMNRTVPHYQAEESSAVRLQMSNGPT